MIDTKRVKSNVIFGDLNFEDYNAFAFGCNLFDRPERSVEVIQIPGRNGDLVLDNGKYNNIDRVYHVQVTGIRNIDALMFRLSSMVGYYRLEDEYEPDVYFTARLKSPPEILQIVGESAHLLITLDRYPQKWLKTNDNTGIHPEYVGYSGSSGARILKFTVNNTEQRSVYYTLRIPINISGDDVFFRIGFMQLDKNITTNVGVIYDADLNRIIGRGYTEYWRNADPNCTEGLIFVIHKEGSTDPIFKNGDLIEFDAETNVLTLNDRLKTENISALQLNAALPIKPGLNYLYLDVSYNKNSYEGYAQQLLPLISLSMRLYRI